MEKIHSAYHHYYHTAIEDSKGAYEDKRHILNPHTREPKQKQFFSIQPEWME